MTAPEAPASSRANWGRLLLVIALILGAVAVVRLTPIADLIAGDRLVSTLESIQSLPAAPVLFVVLFVALTVMGTPISPLLLAGGVAFGVWQGTVLSLIGSLTAGCLSWALARTLGYSLVQQLVGKHLAKIKRLISRKGFWSLVRLRFIPIPFTLVNYALGLLGVPLTTFASSTAVAMTPVIFLWSFFSSALIESTEEARPEAIRSLALILLLLVAISFLPPRIVAWKRAQRYRNLRQQRALKGHRLGTLRKATGSVVER